MLLLFLLLFLPLFYRMLRSLRRPLLNVEMRQTGSRCVLSSHLREDPGSSSRIVLDALEDRLIFIAACPHVLHSNLVCPVSLCRFLPVYIFLNYYMLPHERMPRLCAEDSCDRQCYYGTTYRRPVFCPDHRQPGMVNVKSRRCDHPDGCLAQPAHTTPSMEKRYCTFHARIVGDTFPLKDMRPLITRPASKRAASVFRNLIGSSGQQPKVSTLSC